MKDSLLGLHGLSSDFMYLFVDGRQSWLKDSLTQEDHCMTNSLWCNSELHGTALHDPKIFAQNLNCWQFLHLTYWHDRVYNTEVCYTQETVCLSIGSALLNLCDRLFCNIQFLWILSHFFFLKHFLHCTGIPENRGLKINNIVSFKMLTDKRIVFRSKESSLVEKKIVMETKLIEKDFHGYKMQRGRHFWNFKDIYLALRKFLNFCNVY